MMNRTYWDQMYEIKRPQSKRITIRYTDEEYSDIEEFKKHDEGISTCIKRLTEVGMKTLKNKQHD